jgi:hypothetical protein
MPRTLRFWVLSLLVIILLVSINLAQAAVTLISFNAYPDPDPVNPIISLLWETASELGFYGFYIQRSLNADTGFARLQDTNGDPLFFPAPGDGLGHTYNYDDEDVDLGVTYYYKLEMVEAGGYTSFSNVVPAFLGNTPTPTPSTTATPTSTSGTYTPTATPISTSDTRTPTVTRTPITSSPTRTKTDQPTTTNTRTPTPFHAVTYTSRPRPTSTPTETPTITPTQTVSPTITTTLAPLPSLILLFPVHSSTPTSTSSPTATSSPVPPSPTPTPKSENRIPLRVSFLGGIIILLWLTLAGFLFAYLRRMSR